MTMVIDLDPALESRLREEAAKHGLDVEQLALRLIEQSLPARGANQNSLWKTLTPEEWHL